jgi:hypothetical protein
MKSPLRSRMAAVAMLLIPLGAMVAAGPAAAEHRDGASDRGHGWGHQQDFRADRRAPRIFGVTPDADESIPTRGWTRIIARFQDDESGVAAVFLSVDGHDVSGRARLNNGELRYADDLSPGLHWAQLAVTDRAGNTARRTWQFNVVHQRPYTQDGRGSDRW